ncbi:N-acetylglucosamine-6-phosphate deacetylase [Sphingobacterium pedocola]|uniref:N-acetylglucosamine-6-phosphate deacetylase n=1 Tax=Sphingobacterium pedocola TaxID=2082722 RepID=A0ABR9TBR2_9SPHI|nr:N-acetylglucosamine-6-phosphate deacetylase [Sphingobacterium pedocola]MBE8722807.1 N-acetylglucosamine-6-phosphate deacetylase [Sphingobacterium pedocola]
MNCRIALINGIIYNQYDIIKQKSLLLDGEHIAGIVPIDQIPEDYEHFDVAGAYICPGLIDLQIYGTGDQLFSAELTQESLYAIENQLLLQGCTSFYLTLATNTLDVFKKAIAVFKQSDPKVALGLHLEGPFLNPSKRGAHPEDLVIPASPTLINDLFLDACDVVKMITIAPELIDDVCLNLLKQYKVLMSAGHSAANFEEASASFDNGIDAVTHLWNAMSVLHHRNTGLPGAAFNHHRVSASIIVDGIHVDYEAVKLSKKLLGDRLFLITDAVASCRKGIYQHMLEKDHYVLPDGTLSGSALTLLKAVENCVNHAGISLDEALRMATLYPSRLIKNPLIGNLNSGSLANLLVFNTDFEIKHVFLKGKAINGISE